MFDCGLDPLNLEVGANCSTVILKIVFLDKKWSGQSRTGRTPCYSPSTGVHVQTYASRSTYIADCQFD